MARVSLAAFDEGVRGALRLLHSRLGPDRPAWLVGGAVRDALLGRATQDIDVAVPAGAIELGRALADLLGGAFVALDETRGASRVIGAPPGALQLDLTDFRGPSIEEDLRGRDFTIDALAVPLTPLILDGEAPVIDPTGGLDDLVARRLRLCATDALRADPVRALRAARFGAGPGWTLDPHVERAMQDVATAVVEVAAERLRDEVVAILAEPWSARAIRILDRVGVLAVLLPESLPMRATSQPEPHRFDVWEHSLRALEAMDGLLDRLDGLAPWHDLLQGHLDEDLGDGLTRRESLKLAALLHDVAKPETRVLAEGRVRFIGHDSRGAARALEVARRFRLSGRAASVLERLVRHHLRLMHLGQAGGVTRRARYRFFRDLGEEARDLVLLALADAAAVRGLSPFDVWTGPAGSIPRELMEGLGEDAASAQLPPLVRGEDVMEAFGLAPGPEVGRLLARAREAQALGLATTRDEALAYLRRAEAGAPGELDTSGPGS